MFALTTSPPPDNSVVAGPIGFTVFILLALAVALLCWSFTRQLRKAQRAKDAGVYGDEIVEPETSDASEPHDADA